MKIICKKKKVQKKNTQKSFTKGHKNGVYH